MIHTAHLECDGPDGYTLILEDDDGRHLFPVEPELLDDALAGWREHMAEGEAVRREFERSGGKSWAEHVQSGGESGGYVCPDPEGDWMELLRENADMLRKRWREDGPVVLTDVDPGDETDFEDAA